MNAAFDPNRPETWPPLLTIEHIAVIVDRSITYITKKATVGQFQPAPFRGGGRGNRWEWRKTTVQRFIEGTAIDAPSRLKRVS